MIEQRDGWFVVNVEDARWRLHPAFGHRCSFEVEGKFQDVGINLMVLQPDRPLCRYHRENAQEDFLVLSGACKALVNGEERALRAWDFLHCPPGVSHVLIGAGDGPCAVLAIGHRKGEAAHELFYPREPRAREYGAEAPEPTADPKVAYSDLDLPAECDPPPWPPES